MRPSILKLSTLPIMIAMLSGCGEDAKDCGGFWDKTFGKEACPTTGSTSQNTKTAQTITDLVLPNPFTVGQNHTLAAKSSAGLTITYSSKTADVCSVTGVEVKALKAGACTIEGNQVGNDEFFPISTTFTEQILPLVCELPQLINETKTSCYTPEKLKVGEFIDSAVQGLSYKTPTYSGLTDKNGKFYYVEGEEVSFKISALELGTVLASSRVHVSDLASSSYDKKNNKAAKIAQLLQALDEDKNPENGIVLNNNTQQFFTSDKNIDFLIDDDAFTQLLTEKLTPLSVTIPSQDAVKSHITASLTYVAQGDCPIPVRNIVGYGGVILSNEKLSCNDRARFQSYLTYTMPLYEGLISDVVNPDRINEISNTASREAAKKSIISKALVASASALKTIDAAKQGKMAEAAARLTDTALKIYIIAKPDGTAEEAAKGSTAIIEAVINSADCIKGDEIKCAATIRATLEIPQNDQTFLGKIQPYLGSIIYGLKAVEAIGGVKDNKGMQATAYAVAGYSLAAAVDLLRISTTDSGSVANQMLAEVSQSIIIPTANVASCWNVKNATLNQLGLGIDCLEQVVAPTYENIEVIGRRLYGITSLTVVNTRADGLNIERYALAEIVSASSGNEMYAKWGIPLNTPYEKGIDLLVRKMIDKVRDDDGWYFRTISDVFVGYETQLQMMRSQMVRDIFRELDTIDILSQQMIDASKDIDFKKVDIKNGLATANINFASSNIGGRKVCFSQGSDHSNNNPYIIESSNNSSDSRSLEFRYVTSGNYSINCFAYDKQGNFLQSQANHVFINDDTDYKIDVLPQNTTIYQGDAIHLSLVGKTGILPRLVRWSFGEGTAEVIARPTDAVTHYYYSSGTKHIQAYILDAHNNVTKLTWSIDVQPSSEQKVLVSSFNPKTLRFGQLGEIVLQGINLTEGLQLSCDSCVDGVHENLDKSNNYQRVYAYVPRSNDMTKTLNDTLVVKNTVGTVLTQSNIPIMPAFDIVTASSKDTKVNSEIRFSLSSPLDYVKSVVWSIGDKIIQTLNSIADIFKHIFSTVGEFVVSAELKDKDNNLISHAETIVSVKPLVCTDGQVEQGGKCVPKTIGNLVTILEDDFNDNQDDLSKWQFTGKWNTKPHGSSADLETTTSHTEAQGYLELRMDQTDIGSTVRSMPFSPQNQIRVEMRHYMQQGSSDYYFPQMSLGGIDKSFGMSITWQKSAYNPDNWCVPYNKVQFAYGLDGTGGDKQWTDAAGKTYAAYCMNKNTALVSSDYYNRWITTILDYDVSTGAVTVDLDNDGVIDLTGQVAQEHRTPINQFSIGTFGWWTGHLHRIDYVKVMGIEKSNHNLLIGATVTDSCELSRCPTSVYGSPSNIVDGNIATGRNLGTYRGSFDITLTDAVALKEISITAAMSPNGNVDYEVFTDNGVGGWSSQGRQTTRWVSGQVFNVPFASVVNNVKAVRIVVYNSPSWVALYEVVGI